MVYPLGGFHIEQYGHESVVVRVKWEKFKERGFDLAAVGVIGADIALWVLESTQGTVVINGHGFREPMFWMWLLEISLQILLFIWGIERLSKDWKK